MSRYRIIAVTQRGYIHMATITAATLQDACRQHTKAWHGRLSACQVVMRAPSGKRYSYNDSRAVLEAAA